MATSSMGEVNVDDCLEDVAIPRLCAIKAPCSPFLVCACVPRGLVDESADPERARPISAAPLHPASSWLAGNSPSGSRDRGLALSWHG